MIGFCPLASGSRGNSVYFETKKSKILIDAGIAARTLKNKLSEIDVDIEDLDAIFITHEHSDHIRGLKAALKRNIPIIANSGTAKGIVDNLGENPKFKIFATGETFEFRDLEVHPFTIQHDTNDPVGYVIQTEKLKFGFCTDIGFVTSLVEHKLKKSDCLYIESNHDPMLVNTSPRPLALKRRILGRSGHLSNEACAKLLKSINHADLKHVVLAHLSGECNTPQKALAAAKTAINNDAVNISVANQNHVGEFIRCR